MPADNPISKDPPRDFLYKTGLLFPFIDTSSSQEDLIFPRRFKQI
jgi:hypothetical protein